MMKRSILSRRHVLTLGTAAAASSIMPPAMASAHRPVVVELFTSQGCSSCPPADAFLAELIGMPGVIALTYHVDYWDYLGWKNTLAAPEYSQRQYDYARSRGDMNVYTPQLIIDGNEHFVGSERGAVMDGMVRAKAGPPDVPLSLNEEGPELVIDVGSGSPGDEATVWLMPVIPVVTVKILKGEIAGREVRYQNVVRETVPAGMWNGTAKTMVMPKLGVMGDEATACVALLQRGKVGPVLGSASWGKFDA